MLKRTLPYMQRIPEILVFRGLVSLLLAIVLAGLRWLAAWALASQGRVAVTSGDFLFILTSWQGWLLILVALAALYIYVALDLNVMIAYAGHVVRGEKRTISGTIRAGLAATRALFCPEGAAVIVYIALLAPICGVGLSISLTEGLKIPNFISSVITATPLYSIAYGIVAAVFALIGFLGIFCLHGVVLDGLGVREARVRSRAIIRANWKDYLLKTSLFALGAALLVLLAAVVLLALPLALVEDMAVSGEPRRFLMLSICLLGSLGTALASLVMTPFTIIKMTQLYLGYSTGEPVEIPLREKKLPRAFAAVIALAVLACLGGAALLNGFFDEAFPVRISVDVIAHRGGGNEGAENTVSGLGAAIELGAWGSEIDIQRTADGAYVVVHDNDFERVAGVAARPQELTLAEVRQLSVAGEPVPTLEEMLEAARGNIILFVELKGATADRQMADDVARIIRKAGMLDQCVLISLSYEIIDYIETNYPEIQTGFLAFASYGDLGELNCDYIALEELSATADAMAAIHMQGRGVLVWTVNDEESQRHFLCSEADAIITDDIVQAERVRRELENRSDLERVVDALLAGLS